MERRRDTSAPTGLRAGLRVAQVVGGALWTTSAAVYAGALLAAALEPLAGRRRRGRRPVPAPAVGHHRGRGPVEDSRPRAAADRPTLGAPPERGRHRGP